MFGEKKMILGGLLVAGSICIAGAQTAVNLSGKITDANSGAVVAGVKVSLVGNPDITTTTGADGIFTLTGNATVGLKTGAKAGKAEMSVKGTQLSLKIAGDRTPVSVDVFNLNNRFVRTLVNSTADAGSYSVDVAGFGLKSGMYVVRARVGSQTSAFKVTTLGISGVAGFRSNAAAFSGLAKIAADPIDSLKCTKDGYKIKAIGVTKYSGILTITMNPKLPPGNLKIVSERAFPQVAWGKNVDVAVFDGGTQLDGGYKAESFEGGQSWKVTFKDTQTYNGWGFLTTVEPEDMSAWKGGKMHLAVRGTVTSLAVTMESSDQGAGFSKRIDLAKYGYAPMTSISDVAWHEINVPLDDFEGTDLSQIHVYCAFSYPVETDTNPFDPSAFYLVDDIYWTLK
jgi:hypothetical protein